MATPRHPKPLPLENHILVIALTPDSQNVSFIVNRLPVLQPYYQVHTISKTYKGVLSKP